MELLTKPEVSEMKNPESSGYKEIKPETNITPKEAKECWKKVFDAASDIVNDMIGYFSLPCRTPIPWIPSAILCGSFTS